MKLDLKPVEYFGHTITVPPIVEWLAIDEDGGLFGFMTEPFIKRFEWDDSNDCFFAPVFICNVNLNAKDWRKTKVKV